jgi:probable phosphoglycerate mutase
MVAAVETTTRIVLVRHGEPRAQVDQLVTGHATCRGLSELGRRQAEALRDRLAATGELGRVDALYTSLMTRAIETAEIIRPALGGETGATGDEVEVVRDCGWCEIHPGVAEGLSWTELRERHPVDGDPDDPDRPRVEGAETWAAVYRRVGEGLERLVDEHRGQTVVVVAHGGVVGASLVALGEAPAEDGVRVIRSVTNASTTEWHHSHGTEQEWRMIRFNEAVGMMSP